MMLIINASYLLKTSFLIHLTKNSDRGFTLDPGNPPNNTSTVHVMA